MSKFVLARRRPSVGRRGVASLEFAVVGGVFFFILLAAIDVGRYYMTVQGVRNFAADAERYGIVNMSVAGTSTQTATCAQVLAATGRGGAVGGLVSTSPGACVTRVQTTVGGGAVFQVTVTVNIDVTFNFVINAFGILSPRIVESTTLTYLL